MARKTYQEQGHTFTIVKTSPRNRERLGAYMLQRREQMRAHAEALQLVMTSPPEEIDQIEVPPAPNHNDFYWDVFLLLTEGPHDKLDRADFDEKLGEEVLSDFFPTPTRTMLQQSGFLPLSLS